MELKKLLKEWKALLYEAVDRERLEKLAQLGDEEARRELDKHNFRTSEVSPEDYVRKMFSQGSGKVKFMPNFGDHNLYKWDYLYNDKIYRFTIVKGKGYNTGDIQTYAKPDGERFTWVPSNFESLKATAADMNFYQVADFLFDSFNAEVPLKEDRERLQKLSQLGDEEADSRLSRSSYRKGLLKNKLSLERVESSFPEFEWQQESPHPAIPGGDLPDKAHFLGFHKEYQDGELQLNIYLDARNAFWYNLTYMERKNAYNYGSENYGEEWDHEDLAQGGPYLQWEKMESEIYSEIT